LRGHGRGRTEWILGVSQVILLAVVFLISDAIPLTAQPSSTSAFAHSGEWSAEVDFGEFTLAVNHETTGITQTVFNFSQFKCGGATISSGQVLVESFWPIKDDQFTVDVNLGLYKIVIHGRIDEMSSHVTGDWEIRSIGAVCSGPWASR
jgi:hypothetical protein